MNLMSVFAYLIFAIIMLCITNRIILKKKEMLSFLPFIMVGLLACFQIAFMFHDISNLFVWLGVKIVYVIVLSLIFINLWRENGNRR